MKSTAPNSEADKLHSTAAISAHAKENIRMQARRYQRGSLSLQKRKRQPDAWVFRYYAEENGRRAYKKKIVGTVIEFPKRKDAEKAVAQLRVDVNDGAAFAPMNLEQLIAHYQRVELPLKAYSTAEGYKNYLTLHVLPKWGKQTLSAIKSIEVESWLRNLKRLNGHPASPGTKTKIRNLMSALFAHAIRYEWAAKNPITGVRTSAKRLRTPDILTAEEFQALLLELPQRERVMVLLAGSTGLRRGELIGLRWHDIDLPLRQANVKRSVWRNVQGDTKTEASRKPVPLPALVIEELKQWWSVTLYRSGDDYLFPSIAKNGTQPVTPDMVLKRHVRPALKRIGVTKRIGWHSFRHGLGTMLRQHGVDLKVAQELLRHANSRITMELYQQAVSEEKRLAQNQAFRGLLGEVACSAPFSTLEGGKKATITAINPSNSDVYGGDDGARTRDLCRDSEKEGLNLQKKSVTDGFFWRCKERSGTVIEPISNLRPLPCRPLPCRPLPLGKSIGDSDLFPAWQVSDKMGR
jgi:integrase